MINKILFTIFAVVAIWKAFSWISRLSKSSSGVPSTGQTNDPERAQHPGGPKAVEMTPCPRCGAFVDPREGCSCSARA